MPRHIRIGLVVTVVVAGASILYLMDIAGRLDTIEEPETEPLFSEPAPSYAPNDPEIRVRVFYPALSNDVLLRTQSATIFDSESPESRARQIIEHLVAGSEANVPLGRLPEGTRLNQIFVSGNGTAYLDFNSALADNHPGGILPEQATVYAIVDSLVYNLPEVDRVKLLIGGTEKQTLAGHCLLMLPLEADLSVSDMTVSSPPRDL